MNQKTRSCKNCGKVGTVSSHAAIRLDPANWPWKNAKFEPFIMVINTDLVSRDAEFCKKCFTELVYMAHWELIEKMRKGEENAST